MPIDDMVTSCPSVPDTEFDQGGLLSWSSTSKYLAVSCQKTATFLEITSKNWEVPVKTTVSYSNAMNADITAIAYSPNGKLIALGNSDGTVQVWKTP